MEQLIDSLVKTMEALGYPGIALLMFIEVIFPPIPSEVIMPAAGFAAVKGQLNFFGVVLAGSIGSMLGAVVFYYVGKLLGTERLVKLANRYGRWFTVSGKDIRRASSWFDKYGYAVIFFCRFVPGIRSLVSLPAGVAAMKILPFLLLTLIGNVIWNIALTYMGYFLADKYELVDAYMGDSGKYVLIAIIVILAIVYVVRLVQQMREKPEEEVEEAIQQPAPLQNGQAQVQPAWAQQPASWGQQPSQYAQPSQPVYPTQQSAFAAGAPPANQPQLHGQSWPPQNHQPATVDDDATIIRRPVNAQQSWGQPAGGPQQQSWSQAQQNQAQPQQQPAANQTPTEEATHRQGPNHSFWVKRTQLKPYPDESNGHHTGQ